MSIEWVCDRCYRPTTEGDHGLGRCPFERRRVAPAVRQDTIEGGLLIAHGLCHPDGTPRRYDSRTEIRQEAAARGLIQWSEVYTEDRTKDARVHDDWLRSGEAQRAKRDRDAARRERQFAKAGR
jgi:hypothetical protein